MQTFSWGVVLGVFEMFKENVSFRRDVFRVSERIRVELNQFFFELECSFGIGKLAGFRGAPKLIGAFLLTVCNFAISNRGASSDVFGRLTDRRRIQGGRFFSIVGLLFGDDLNCLKLFGF